MKKGVLIVLFFTVFSGIANAAYVDKPVLTHVRAAGQHDTVGFNLAQDLPNFIYAKLAEGRLTLWDSPAKVTKINFLALQQVETSSASKFVDCSDLFLYEFWDCTRNKLKFVMAGISFVYYREGKLKPYGYIDAQEAFRLLATHYIPCNANAPADLTYWQALNSKRFNFSIVQYGRKNFTKNPIKSIEIKDKVFNDKRKLDPKIIWASSKNISYKLVEDYSKDYDYAINLKKGLEQYINKNREIVKNHDPGYFYKDEEFKGYFTINDIYFYETWEKRGSLLISHVDSIVLIVNNKRLKAFTEEDLRSINLRIKFKSVIDVLKEKDFDLTIVEINRVPIAPQNRKLYKKALEGYSWTRLTEYVKYENKND